MKKEEIQLIEEMIINCRSKKEYVDEKAEAKAIALEKLLKVYKRMQVASKNYLKNNKEKIYKRQKEKYYKDKETIGTYYQRNKEKCRSRINEYRKRKVEKLKEQGVKNAWSVVAHGEEPKYKV